MSEKRRDNRIEVRMSFLLSDPDSKREWRCKTLDISPTGILLQIEEDPKPALDSIVDVTVQGPAETGWAHINTRPMRVVRVEGKQIGLSYI